MYYLVFCQGLLMNIWIWIWCSCGSHVTVGYWQCSKSKLY